MLLLPDPRSSTALRSWSRCLSSRPRARLQVLVHQPGEQPTIAGEFHPLSTSPVSRPVPNGGADRSWLRVPAVLVLDELTVSNFGDGETELGFSMVFVAVCVAAELPEVRQHELVRFDAPTQPPSAWLAEFWPCLVGASSRRQRRCPTQHTAFSLRRCHSRGLGAGSQCRRAGRGQQLRPKSVPAGPSRDGLRRRTQL